MKAVDYLACLALNVKSLFIIKFPHHFFLLELVYREK